MSKKQGCCDVDPERCAGMCGLEKRRYWDFVSPDSMFLVALIEEDTYQGEVVYARIIWCIRQFWVWKLLYGKTKDF